MRRFWGAGDSNPVHGAGSKGGFKALERLMIRIPTSIGAVALACLLAIPAAAEKPRAHIAAPVRLPPPALCRIWFRGLPADQQPRPTDCRTARRQAAISGGQVIVGSGEPGGAFRFDDSADRYRRETEARDARERERYLRDRDRDWRDGTWNDRDWHDEVEPRG